MVAEIDPPEFTVTEPLAEHPLGEETSLDFGGCAGLFGRQGLPDCP